MAVQYSQEATLLAGSLYRQDVAHKAQIDGVIGGLAALAIALTVVLFKDMAVKDFLNWNNALIIGSVAPTVAFTSLVAQATIFSNPDQGRVGQERAVIYELDRQRRESGSQDTLLVWTINNGTSAAVELLLRAGANPNTPSQSESPLSAALRRAQAERDGAVSYDVLDQLVRAGADVNLQVGGNALVHYAARLGDVETIAWAVKHQANLNVKTAGGSTPLHLAVTSDRESAVRALTMHGADHTIRHSTSGRTPLEEAYSLQQDGLCLNLMASRKILLSEEVVASVRLARSMDLSTIPNGSVPTVFTQAVMSESQATRERATQLRQHRAYLAGIEIVEEVNARLAAQGPLSIATNVSPEFQEA